MAGMSSGATSTYSGGRGGLTATPYQVDTTLADVRGFGNFNTDRRKLPTARMQQVALRQPSTALGSADPNKKMAELAIRQAQAAADIAEARARAMTQSAPTKQLHGFNMAGRIMDDPENLTGAQREVFLPDNASTVSAGSNGPTAHLSPDAPAEPDVADSGSAMRTWMQMQALLRGGR